MNIIKKIHNSYVKSILDYNQETGEFIWKYREDRSKAWNIRYSGKIAGNKRKDGYISIRINGISHLAHRLAWSISHDEDKEFIIDHINGNPSDNRILNLRKCDISENGLNRSKPSNNSTGYKNILFISNRNKFEVKTTVNK